MAIHDRAAHARVILRGDRRPRRRFGVAGELRDAGNPAGLVTAVELDGAARRGQGPPQRIRLGVQPERVLDDVDVRELGPEMRIVRIYLQARFER